MISRMWSRELPSPSGPEGQLGRPGDLLVGHHGRPRLEAVEALLDDLQRLAHLLDADQVAGVVVAVRVGRDVEVVGLVAAVGHLLAHVPGEARRAQQRSRHTQGDAAGDVEVAGALEPGLPDRLAGQQLVVLVDALGHHLQELADLLDRARRQVLRDAAGTDVVVVHPQAGDHLEDVEHHLALAEAVEHRRHGADLHAAGRDPHAVGGDPVELHHQHPNDGDPLRDLVGDAEQPLDGRGSRRSR